MAESYTGTYSIDWSKEPLWDLEHDLSFTEMTGTRWEWMRGLGPFYPHKIGGEVPG